MANVMHDLRLFSRPQSVTARWPVLNYTAWWQGHNCPESLRNSPPTGNKTRNL